jgi:1-acyl-sn-glycerol-3-phosphate acyltransferase
MTSSEPQQHADDAGDALPGTPAGDVAGELTLPLEVRPGERPPRLLSAGFLGLLATQFLGATNDNAFRLLVIGICKSKVAPEHSSMIVSAGLACFTLPYLLLAAPAGYFADRFSKRTVIVVCKVAEIGLMMAAIGAIWWGDVYAVLFVLLLMGSQSALFGPAKLGSIPELLPGDRISAANGLMGLVTITATVAGVALGNWLFSITGPVGHNHLWLSALMLIGVAALGTGTSLFLPNLLPANPRQPFPAHLLRQTWGGLRTLASNGPMLRVALGIAFFWSLGALAQSNVLEFGAEGGMLQEETNPLLGAMVCGVGLGSVLAGYWSGGKVELGILPLGAAGMAIGSMLLFTVSSQLAALDVAWTSAKIWACVWLFLLGVSAGLFDVPLTSYMQHRSSREARGAILAASNFITFAGILAVAGAYVLLRFPLLPPPAGTGPTLGSLAEEERRAVQPIVDDFRAAWEPVAAANRQRLSEKPRLGGPPLREFVSRAERESRPALLAELVRIDAEQLRTFDYSAAVRDYRREFPDRGDIELVRAVLQERAPLLTARQVFLLSGALTVPIFIYMVWLLPEASVRFLVWLASRTMYRVRIEGRENLPERGGALLAANHVTWLDAVLLLTASSRPLRMVAARQYLAAWWIRWVVRRLRVITLDTSSPGAVRATIDTARTALKQGELVCVFPEGTITRSGELQPFRRGLLAIAEGTEAPIVPVYLDELWGSIFSYHGGRVLWKIPRRWPYPVTIRLGPALSPGAEPDEIRAAVERLAKPALE